MSHTHKDARGHMEPRLARRAEHRIKRCTHGLPRLECDACEAERIWRGVRYTSTLVECLDVEMGTHSDEIERILKLPEGSISR